MARRKIDVADGVAAVRTWAADPAAAPRSIRALAVRYSLEALADLAPGRSVEVRVPPFGVTQILKGTVHTRGTHRRLWKLLLIPGWRWSPDSWLGRMWWPRRRRRPGQRTI